MDMLLQYREPTTGQGLSDDEIRAEVDTFMFEVSLCSVIHCWEYVFWPSYQIAMLIVFYQYLIEF